MDKVVLNFKYENCIQENIFLISTKNTIDDSLISYLNKLGKLKYTLGEAYRVFLVDGPDFFITGRRGENELKFRVKEHKSKMANQLIENFMNDLNKL